LARDQEIKQAASLTILPEELKPSISSKSNELFNTTNTLGKNIGVRIYFLQNSPINKHIEWAKNSSD